MTYADLNTFGLRAAAASVMVHGLQMVLGSVFEHI